MHITITETVNTDPFVDADSAMHALKQAAEIVETLLQFSEDIDHLDLFDSRKLYEISNLLFTALTFLGDFDENIPLSNDFD